MRGIDYDNSLFARYADGRALCGDTGRIWMESLARHMPARPGLTILDLGTGTGRFSALLAESFDSRVIAVDPSQKMLAEAARTKPHLRVEYVYGAAEDLPIVDDSIDVAFASMVVHHFRDRPAAARELNRVLRCSGVVCIRNSFAGRLESVRYYEFFPEVRVVDERRLPTVEAVRHIFESCGFEFVALDTVDQVVDLNLADHFERLKQRATSTFEYLTEVEIARGMERMRQAVESTTDSGPIRELIDLLVLRKRF